ncbi:MAG: hypothetical protein QOD51_2503 [Candidatus Eremiobacteraeota bacterium]|nr:hypothetical protein [Candidatus Eremiobacteraeota bacterium]
MVGFAVAALAVGAAAKSTDAPADEYFGPFKYSAISVRSKITALGRSYRERWADNASIVHDAMLLESSYRVWAQKYPQDVWLAPTAYHLAQLYQEVQTQDARNHARAMYEYLAKTYPKSKEAHFARLRLAQGFPELHAETPVSPTPNPYAGAPAPAASPSAEAAAAAAPASPAATASGAPSAAPAASAPAAPAAATASPAPPAPATSASPAAPSAAPASAKPAAAASPKP